MYKAENLSKSYISKRKFSQLLKKRDKKKVLNNVNLNIEKGKVIGLLGLNGAGKTSLIKILTTISSYDSGKIYCDDMVVTPKNKIEVRKKINLITGGERNLYWRLSGYENLRYFGTLYNIKALDERIDEVLSIVGLTDSKNIPVEKYSKGMKQRLQIAKGLINNPEYLFLDEPTLGLDVHISKEIRTYIRKLSEDYNKGVLITSHILEEIEEICDYVYVLNRGEIISEGSIADILMEFKKEHSFKITLHSKREMEILKEIMDQESYSYDICSENTINILTLENNELELHRIIRENNLNIMYFIHKPPKLEDIIMEIERR
ncbi:ABC transporter ATP-binding protein [Oceanobacillus luteolus]|uniref:ABC transporter ATP-binding protein n=1 Tax=Oceanobacillus luteolus TaxID=1274358 RepID=A0ABW4HT47_9BACI